MKTEPQQKDLVEEARRLRTLKAKRWGRDILRRSHEDRVRAQQKENRKREIPAWMRRLAVKETSTSD